MSRNENVTFYIQLEIQRLTEQHKHRKKRQTTVTVNKIPNHIRLKTSNHCVSSYLPLATSGIMSYAFVVLSVSLQLFSAYMCFFVSAVRTRKRETECMYVRVYLCM